MDHMQMSYLADRAEDAIVSLRSRGLDRDGSGSHHEFNALLEIRDALDEAVGGPEHRKAWVSLDSMLAEAQRNGMLYPEDSAEGLDAIALGRAVEARDWRNAWHRASPFLSYHAWDEVRDCAATLGLDKDPQSSASWPLTHPETA